MTFSYPSLSIELWRTLRSPTSMQLVVAALLWTVLLYFPCRYKTLWRDSLEEHDPLSYEHSVLDANRKLRE